MQTFFALVDAVPGREREVEEALRHVPAITGVAACKAGNHDFLVRFQAASASVVDDVLQTHVRRLPGVKGVEPVTDFADQPAVVREARARIEGPGARRAVVLLSGGLDSTVAAALARERGFEVHALSFDYGQRHRRELESARAVAKALGAASHTVMQVPIAAYGASALTDPGIAVPTGRDAELERLRVSSLAGAAGRDEAQMGADIPVTYVPARNIVFLSLALGLAEARDAEAIFIGANALDYSGYPDCRPEFFAAFEEVARRGTKRGVEGKPLAIEVPLQHMTKADIVREGLRVKAPLDLTWSCYQGGEKSCGVCDSCVLRLKGFREAGARDPVPYA